MTVRIGTLTEAITCHNNGFSLASSGRPVADDLALARFQTLRAQNQHSDGDSDHSFVISIARGAQIR